MLHVMLYFESQITGIPQLMFLDVNTGYSYYVNTKGKRGNTTNMMTTFGPVLRGIYANGRSWKVSATEKNLFRFPKPVHLNQAGAKGTPKKLSLPEKKSEPAIGTMYKHICQ